MLVVDGISRSFLDAGRGRVEAVASVSFRVAAGEVYGLLGPNGAGKTTTLRLIATLIPPERGSVRIDGVDARQAPLAAREKLAYVPAETGLPPELSGEEVVSLFARIQGVASPVAAAREVLAALGASAFARSPCGGLSTGQRRRIVLARALVHRPKVLLLDEPTDGLDVGGRQEVLALVRTLARDGRAVVFSSHILSEVEAVCDRVGVLYQGRLVQEGTLAALRAQTGESDFARAFLKLTGYEQ